MMIDLDLDGVANEVVARIESGLAIDSLLVLAPNVKLMKTLRAKVYEQLVRGGDVSFNTEFIRTPSSVAYTALPAVLRLITGPEQDKLIRCLLENFDADPIYRLQGYASEVRNLFDTANEYNINPDRLREMGRPPKIHSDGANTGGFDIPEWVKIADLFEEYRAYLLEKKLVDHSSLLNLAARNLAEMTPGEMPYAEIICAQCQDFSAAALRFVSQLAEVSSPEKPQINGVFGLSKNSAVKVLKFGSPQRSVIGFKGAGEAGSGSSLEKIDPKVKVKAYKSPDLSAQIDFIIQDFRKKRVVAEFSVSQKTLTNAEFLAAPKTPTNSEISAGNPPIPAPPSAAIIARSSRDLAWAARKISAAGIPVSFNSSKIPLRDEKLYQRFKTEIESKGAQTPQEPASKEADAQQNPASKKPDLLQKPAFEALWAVWQRWGVAEKWQMEVISGENPAKFAHLLDVAAAIFRQAEALQTRDFQASAQEFFKTVDEFEFPADNIEQQSQAEALQLLTPAAAAGLKFDSVYLIEINDGVWPNLRTRDSILRWGLLADAASGRVKNPQEIRYQDTLQATRSSEIEMFNAAQATAARELFLFATSSQEENPSDFLKEFALEDLPFQQNLYSLDELVASAKIAGGSESAALLRQARERGVLQADPSEWDFLLPPGAQLTPEPIWGAEDLIELTPSKLETAYQCPLKFVLSEIGKDRSETNAMLGEIVHKIAELLPDADFDTLWEKFLEITSSEKEEFTNFHLEFAREYDKAAFHEKAKEKLDSLAFYYSQCALAKSEVVDCEHKFQIDIPEEKIGGQNICIKGRVDRIERAENGDLHIIDFKTGASKSQADALEDMQLLAYQLGLLEDSELAGVTLAKLVYLGANSPGSDAPVVRRQPSIKNPTNVCLSSNAAHSKKHNDASLWDSDDKTCAKEGNFAPSLSFEEIYSRVEQVGNDLRAASPEARPDESKQCKYCLFKSICPALAQ